MGGAICTTIKEQLLAKDWVKSFQEARFFLEMLLKKFALWAYYNNLNVNILI